MGRRLGRIVDRLFALPIRVSVRFTAVRVVEVRGNLQREAMILEVLPGQELPRVGEAFQCERVAELPSEPSSGYRRSRETLVPLLWAG